MKSIFIGSPSIKRPTPSASILEPVTVAIFGIGGAHTQVQLGRMY